jgi:hypothetical protein
MWLRNTLEEREDNPPEHELDDSDRLDQNLKEMAKKLSRMRSK